MIVPILFYPTQQDKETPEVSLTSFLLTTNLNHVTL